MKLKELLSKVEFSDVAEELVKFNQCTVEVLWLFKQAFDRLRMLPMEEDDGDIIDITGWEIHMAYAGPAWFKALAGEVKAPKRAPLKKVAAFSLFAFTQLSFDYDELSEILGNDFESRYIYNKKYEERELDENPYRREWVKLWQENHDLNCVNPEDIGKRVFTHKGRYDLKLLFPEKDERRKEVKKLLEDVARKMRRYDLLTEFYKQCKFDNETTEKLIERLMNGSSFEVDTIKAVCKPSEVTDYLKDVILRWYFPRKGSASLVIVQCPSEVDENAVCETVSAAFGTSGKLPHPTYLVAPNRNVREAILKVINFE